MGGQPLCHPNVSLLRQFCRFLECLGLCLAEQTPPLWGQRDKTDESYWVPEQLELLTHALRPEMSRLVRRALAFSKTLDNYARALALFLERPQPLSVSLTMTSRHYHSFS